MHGRWPAVRKVASFLHLPASGVAIDIENLRQALEAVQPRRFNISARRLGNIRSLFVRALVMAGAHVEPLRLNAQLSPRWAKLTRQLTTPMTSKRWLGFRSGVRCGELSQKT